MTVLSNSSHPVEVHSLSTRCMSRWPSRTTGKQFAAGQPKPLLMRCIGSRHLNWFPAWKTHARDPSKTLNMAEDPPTTKAANQVAGDGTGPQSQNGGLTVELMQ